MARKGGGVFGGMYRYFLVACSFKNVEDGWKWAFMGAYVLNLDRDRRFLWEELAVLYSLWDIPWCLSGQFYITQFPSEC